MKTQWQLAASLWICVLSPGISSALLSQVPDAPRATSRQLALEARRVPKPGSLCDLAQPRRPNQLTFAPGARVTVRGCTDLDSLQVTAVWITVRNRDTVTTLAIELPPPESVTVGTSRGASRAVALWIAAGGQPGFATEVSGISTTLKPGATLELLYLVPSAVPGSRLTIGGYGTVQLRPN